MLWELIQIAIILAIGITIGWLVPRPQWHTDLTNDTVAKSRELLDKVSSKKTAEKETTTESKSTDEPTIL